MDEYQKLALLISLYDEPNKSRRNELFYCLKENQNNPLISRIHILYEGAGHKNLWFEENLNSDKIVVDRISRRPSFKDFFALANKTYLGHLIIVANSDIIFDSGLNDLIETNLESTILCLSRYNSTSSDIEKLIRTSRGLPNLFSSDSWIFRSPITIDFHCDYALGTMYSDSFLINQLRKSNKIKAYNPCLDIKTLHIQENISESQEQLSGNQHKMQEIWQKEFLRNGKEDPVSGLKWCHLSDIPSRDDHYHRWKGHNLIISNLDKEDFDDYLEEILKIKQVVDFNIWVAQPAIYQMIQKSLNDVLTYPFTTLPKNSQSARTISEIKKIFLSNKNSTLVLDHEFSITKKWWQKWRRSTRPIKDE